MNALKYMKMLGLLHIYRKSRKPRSKTSLRNKSFHMLLIKIN